MNISSDRCWRSDISSDCFSATEKNIATRTHTHTQTNKNFLLRFFSVWLRNRKSLSLCESFFNLSSLYFLSLSFALFLYLSPFTENLTLCFHHYFLISIYIFCLICFCFLFFVFFKCRRLRKMVVLELNTTALKKEYLFSDAVTN